jgi:hypothetical protein
MPPSALHLLHRAEQIADRLFLADAPRSITPRQLAVLVAVAENEGLAKLMLASAPALTGRPP